jgi:hypothetical protein
MKTVHSGGFGSGEGFGERALKDRPKVTVASVNW